MVMALNDFKSVVKDVARPNRFLVQIVPNPLVFTPPTSGANLLDAAKTAAAGARVLAGNPLNWFYMVKTIDLPSRTLGVLEHKRLGVTRKVAGNPTYEDLTITFLNDTGYVGRSLIDAWHENIFQQASNTRQLDSNYSSGSFILVEHMGPNNLPIAIYKFNDVWPSAINAVTLDTESTDTASEFTVSFTYNNWTRII